MSAESLAFDEWPRSRSAFPAAPAVPKTGSALVEEVADASRDAGLAFLAGVRSGFDKQAVADWLVGPYKRATSLGAARMASRRFNSSPPPAVVSAMEKALVNGPMRMRAVTHESLDEVLHRSRLHVLAAMESASRSRTRPAFVQQAIARAEVVSLDVGGVIGFFPRDVPRLRLRERVLALFAADYLARPSSYTEELLVCPWCESVGFDAAAREVGTCSEHRRVSGIELKSSESGERAAVRPVNDRHELDVERDEETGDGYTLYLRRLIHAH